MKSTCILFLTIMLAVIVSCGDGDNVIEDKDWKLVWSDEFDGEAGESPDSTKWKFDIGTDWGNNQLEWDSDRPENASTDGEGNLQIISRREQLFGRSFTSARIKTQDLFEQTYGRFEARIQLPSGQGIWPAFWLLGADIEEVSWPDCGEIDIMEMRGQEPSVIHGSVHGPGYFGGGAVTSSYTLNNDRFDNDFHLFAVEWDEDSIVYYVDDTPYLRITASDLPGEWAFDDPFFIILNVAVGGNYVGSPNDNTRFPQTMLIDYVRVYVEE